MAEKFRRCSGRSRREKLDTLALFAFLISNYSHTGEEFVGKVYRRFKFTSSEIETYKQDIGTWKICPAYFIIEITDIKLSAPRSFDISTISHYPVEQEVLLPPGMIFKIINIEQISHNNSIISIRI